MDNYGCQDGITLSSLIVLSICVQAALYIIPIITSKRRFTPSNMGIMSKMR